MNVKWMDKWVNAVSSTQEASQKHRLKLVPLLGWNDLPCDPVSQVFLFQPRCDNE